MFSNKFKILKIIVPLLIISVAIMYGEMKGPLLFPGYLEAIKNPKNFIHKEIGLGGKILEIKKNYFIIEGEKREIKVIGALDKNKQDHLITGRGIFQKDGSVKLLQYHTSNLRQYKIVLSIIPILIIAYLFFKQYRFNIKKFTFIKT